MTEYDNDQQQTTSTFFRSELMSLIQLYIPTELAQPTVSELGETGIIQFKDLNAGVNAFQRAFVNEVRRLDDMERRVRFLSSQIEKQGIRLPPLDISTATMPEITPRNAQQIDDLDEGLANHEHRVMQMNSNYASLQKRYLELAEMKHVLNEAASFLQSSQRAEDEYRSSAEHSATSDNPLLDNHGHKDNQDLETGNSAALDRSAVHMNLESVSGVIPRHRMATFERILWRALRGNLYMNTAEIKEPIVDPVTDEVVNKNVFVIFAHGKELMTKIRKISESLGASLYPVDSDPAKRRDAGFVVTGRLEDLSQVIQSTNQARQVELTKVAESINSWMITVKKEKAIYHAMNLFNYDPNRKCLIAEGWCPTESIPIVQQALRRVKERSNALIPSILHEIPTKQEPPTFHRTNKFTKGFQEIVDAYGVARYREVNPGLFTVITFPFLFAVMFGDIGHGILVSLFAGFMIWKEKGLAKKDYGEIFGTMFSGRYIIMLMGLFSIYTGFIYNDLFSRAIYLTDSGWEYPEIKPDMVQFEPQSESWKLKTSLAAYSVSTYPFGVDPAWHLAENALIFTNSYKMKMAVIFGVVQMSFGIILNVFNHINFKRRKFIVAEFLPQILFMLSIFGYLSSIIIYKWSIDWFPNIRKENMHLTQSANAKQPPSLLNTLIYMFLAPGTVKSDDELFSGQGTLQAALVLLALVCVPWMLLAKPLILRGEMKAREEAGYNNHGENAVATEEEHDEEHTFGDIMIHQSIHTIEFCLGCISNTASYLRLWALSLAHAQLSEVLWDMLFHKIAFHMTGITEIFGLFVAFFFWFVLTVGILLIMEGLSAFLHALRLHWVEFNNKFYEGTGQKFMPFSFNAVFNPETD